MRIALFSDIHGVLLSLEAVLADIDRQRVDQMVCLGDVAALGPQPREVMARLKALHCPCVMGNHDTDLIEPDSMQAHDPWIAEVTAWGIDQLSDGDLEFLRTFQPRIHVSLDAQTTLLCFHGSPSSNTDRILATTPAEELDELLGGHTEPVMACGHNHVQMVRRHRGIVIIDVGSVGQPFEQMPFEEPRIMPWAEYAIIDRTKGVLSIDLRHVPIDLDAIKQAALTSSMPGADDWVSWWIG
jgi:predicted phosphodiesterase